jgi:hypothetical protein
VSDRFAASALRLAGVAGRAFGWTPNDFWRATPAELATLADVPGEDAGDAVDAATLTRLMREMPDG